MYRADYEQTAADLNLTRGAEIVRSEKEIPLGYVQVSDLPGPQRIYKMIDRGLMFFYDVRSNLDQQKAGALFVWAPDAVRLAVYWTQGECGASHGAKQEQKPIHFREFSANSELAILAELGRLNRMMEDMKRPWWKRIFRVFGRAV